MPERNNNLESGDALRREEHPLGLRIISCPKGPTGKEAKVGEGATCADMNILEPQ